MNTMNLSRRTVMAGGALLVGFRLAPALAADATNEGDLKVAPALDSWVRISPDGDITVLTGKAELGQGISTAIIQVAAEELDVRPERIMLITADTGRTPNEGYTAGSHSMDDSGTAVRDAAACVRALLMQAAALRWGVPPGRLQTADGVVLAPDGRRATYGSLVGAVDLHRPVLDPLPLRPASAYTLVGRSMPRVDIPAKLTGIPSFVQDMRLPGMLHGRVVRPIAYGGALLGVDEGAALRIPGVVKVVREGSFLGVIAEREFAAIQAMRALAASARWEPGHALPKPDDVGTFLQTSPTQDIAVLNRAGSGEAAKDVLKARYTRPFLAHGAIGPSCAVALYEPDDTLTVWTHTQGFFPCVGRLPNCCTYPRPRCAASTWKAPAAMARTAPTTPQRMPRCWPARCRVAQSASSGCGSKSRTGSWTGRRWWRKCRVRWTERAGWPTGTSRSGATRIRNALAQPACCWPRRQWIRRFRCRRQSRSRCRRAGVIATASRSTTFPRPTSFTTSFRECRCAFPPCGHSAPI